MIDYELQTPINGTKVLHLDFESLSLADLKIAKRVKQLTCEAKDLAVGSDALSPRLDSEMRTGIAWAAAIKGTRDLTLNDALLLSVKDALCLSEVALSEYLF